MAQLHKNFTDHQVKELICRYLGKEIERSYIEEILGIGKTRFFALVKKYNKDPDNFSIEYKRKGTSRKISKDIEDSIMKELVIEKQLIEDPEVPLRSYNYSYIKDRLLSNYGQKVSMLQLFPELKEVAFTLKNLKERLMTEKY